MAVLIGIALVVAVLFLPQAWVRYVMGRYNRVPEENFPGNGGELARHLLNRFGLEEVAVEKTDIGDHYDPIERKVRLTPDKFEGRTLTAITVAAHECGHAFQHAGQETLFMWRSRLAAAGVWAARIGSFLLFAAPFLALLARAPSPALISVLGGFLVMGFGVVVQLLTLPVELDASSRAKKLLYQYNIVDKQELAGVTSVLNEAAWTYVVAAIAAILQLAYWVMRLSSRR